MSEPGEKADFSVRVEIDGTVVLTDEESFEIYFEGDQWDELVDEVEEMRDDREERLSRMS